jgi:hypothetical protein
VFLNCSTCFGRHTAHHQEPKTVIATSGFTYVFDCWPLRWLSHRSRQPKTYVKPEATITVFELLMMGGVSPETCWAIKNTGIINSTTRLHLVGSFYEIYTTMHGSMNIKFMASLLAKIMFANYNSWLLRQHTVNQYLFVFHRVIKASYLVTQP